MTDQIFVEGIKFHGFHGLTKLERQVGVRLSVDVTLHLDLEKSGRSDRMADTLDYALVHKKVIEVGRGKSVQAARGVRAQSCGGVPGGLRGG
jgi:dihydroneopterin aldolase